MRLRLLHDRLRHGCSLCIVLSIAMAVVLRKNFGMLSLLPRLESGSIWESVLVPLCGWMFLEENFGAWQVLGIGLILAGALLQREPLRAP